MAFFPLDVPPAETTKSERVAKATAGPVEAQPLADGTIRSLCCAFPSDLTALAKILHAGLSVETIIAAMARRRAFAFGPTARNLRHGSARELLPEVRDANKEKAKRLLWFKVVAQETNAYDFRGDSIGLLPIAQQFAVSAADGALAIDVLFAKVIRELDTTAKDFVVRVRAISVCRAFAFAIEDQKRRTSTGVPEDEDTTVHVWLHDLLVETFRGCECLVLWANGDSASSKAHRASWAKRLWANYLFGNYDYESRLRLIGFMKANYDPDSADRVMSASRSGQDIGVRFSTDEREYWSSKWRGQSVDNRTKRKVAKRAYTTRSFFLEGSINEKVRNRYSLNDTFGFQFAGDLPEIFVMKLRFTGALRLYQIASLRLPRHGRDFTLVSLLGMLWSVRERMRRDHEAEEMSAAAAFADTDTNVHTLFSTSSPERTVVGHPTLHKTR
ncbi:hypothetical protein BDZ88DRAFT_442337 [Geranomyces variabilis]|nr:hypothetical protein BDZ88DRAFT_442337 [Geranomyces variabilis]